jgi:hypothetical protein
MKRFLKNILYLVLIVLPAWYALDYMTTHGLRKSTTDQFAEWNDIYGGKSRANLLIMGSSKARMMISPAVLDTMFHVNSYNMGMDGWQFTMQYARFRIYLQHNPPPAYIIQVIDMPFFNDRTDLFEYDQFIPYLHDTIISNITDRYSGRFTFAERIIPLFIYNQHFTLIKEGLSAFFTKDPEQHSHLKGYKPWKLQWDGSFDRFKRSNPQGITEVILQRVVNEFEAYLSYCRAHHIKVIMDYTPVYYEEQPMERNAAAIRQLFTRLSMKYDMPILDYTHDSLCYQKKYFFNSQHMNVAGAEIYSKTLAHDLDKIINKEQ